MPQNAARILSLFLLDALLWLFVDAPCTDEPLWCRNERAPLLLLPCASQARERSGIWRKKFILVETMPGVCSRLRDCHRLPGSQQARTDLAFASGEVQLISGMLRLQQICWRCRAAFPSFWAAKHSHNYHWPQNQDSQISYLAFPWAFLLETCNMLRNGGTSEDNPFKHKSEWDDISDCNADFLD